ncbi:MAG: MaoC family dehydratase, partial [Pseudomonadota bacterium]|nr:MaoC family dehydratase [Pseudomonadota bacterium]
MMMTPDAGGRFFEDFTLGEKITHATPRTLESGDMALYQALYGGRHILNSSRPAAQAAGYADRPLENWLVFHIVFGKTVPDISRNAVANLGYAEGRFLAPVYCGDTVSAVSEVTGLRENSNGKSGIVMVRSRGFNQRQDMVVEYVRWVMVNKRDPSASAPDPVMPQLAPAVAPADLVPPPTGLAEGINTLDSAQSGSDKYFDDYETGMFIDHHDGVTLEDSEHMLATRAYQNTARVHFDGLAQQETRFGKRLIYGGHIISHARA